MNNIINKFDPTSPEHVKWLACVHMSARNMEKMRMDEIANKNPFGVKINPLDIPEIQFLLDAKYVDAILEKKAHIL